MILIMQSNRTVESDKSPTFRFYQGREGKASLPCRDCLAWITEPNVSSGLINSHTVFIFTLVTFRRLSNPLRLTTTLCKGIGTHFYPPGCTPLCGTMILSCSLSILSCSTFLLSWSWSFLLRCSSVPLRRKLVASLLEHSFMSSSPRRLEAGRRVSVTSF